MYIVYKILFVYLYIPVPVVNKCIGSRCTHFYLHSNIIISLWNMVIRQNDVGL